MDEEKTQPDESARREARLLLDVLIPVVKAWPSEWCLEANKHAIQILGGYTQDFPVERLYRDNRLNMIHEGTNGIHAIDLLGRKVMMQNDAGFALLMREIQKSLDVAAKQSVLSEFVAGLEQAQKTLIDATNILTEAAATGKLAQSMANSSVYLDMFGHVVIAWIWLKQVVAAQPGLAAANAADKQFYLGKMQACRYYYRWELPKITAQAKLLSGLDTTCLDMPEEAFAG